MWFDASSAGSPHPRATSRRVPAPRLRIVSTSHGRRQRSIRRTARPPGPARTPRGRAPRAGFSRPSCRAASASAWRSRARSRASHACCCSTSRSARSTRSPASRSATSSATSSSGLRLPTLLVTHAFEDAAVAGRADRGDRPRRASCSCGSAADLLAEPASVTRRRAHRRQHRRRGPPSLARFGSTVRLAGGGELRSATTAQAASKSPSIHGSSS